MNSIHSPVVFSVIYLTAFMAMAVMSIVLSVVTLNIHHGGSDMRLPRWLRLIVFHGLARITCAGKLVTPYNVEVRVHRCSSTDRRSATHGNAPSRHFDRNHDGASVLLDGSSQDSGVKDRDASLIDSSNTPILYEILRELKSITSRLAADDELSFIAEEWRIAARLVDRFFIMVYVIVNCVVTVGCLTSAIVGGQLS